MNDVKKTRKPSENVELSMPLGAAVKKAAESLEIPQSVVREAYTSWAAGELQGRLTKGDNEETRSYEQALKEITLQHLTSKMRMFGRSAQ